MRTVLVTGAGGILGGAIVRQLLEADRHVVAIDRELKRLEALREKSRTGRGELETIHTDLTHRPSLLAIRDELQRRGLTIDSLVNNAASKSESFFEPFETFPESDWSSVMDVNVTAVMRCCQIFGTVMAERGEGSIVNIASIYGVVAPDQRIYEGSEYEGRSINTPAVYTVSKAAVVGLTRYLAAYWGNRGLRINAVTPGGIQSGQNDTFVRRYSEKVPLGRMAVRDEIASAVCFLLTDDASYINGHNLIVDGGFSVW